MISSLSGTVIAVTSQWCDIDVHGVGYHLSITADHANTLKVGSNVSILTSLIVREDSMTLYGFPSEEGRELFSALIGVSGVGPRSALAILSHLSPAEIMNAVLEEDDSVFKKVSGIGPKTAKLIVVQLSGKINLVLSETTPESSSGASSVASSVVMALVGLGWNEKQSRDAVEIVSEQAFTDSSALLRATLSYLAGK
jgi:Holliday junction DNA helicase RuvA